MDIRRAPHEVDDALRDYMESEARDLLGEELTRFMHAVYGRVHGLIQRCPSNQPLCYDVPHFDRSSWLRFCSPPSDHISLYSVSLSQDN